MPKIAGKHIAAASASMLVVAGASVAKYEGLFTSPYLDIVGVRTVCYGETAADHVNLHRSYTAQECRDMLSASLARYDADMVKCLHRDIPASMHIAFLSATYNIGVGGFCRSTMAARVNAGDLRGACEALLKWDRAGGRVIKGLHNRRASERAMCLRDLDALASIRAEAAP